MNVSSKQTNLFDDENYYRNAYHVALREFNIEQAIKELKKWQKTFFPPADLHKKIIALMKLATVSTDDINVLSELYAGLYNTDYLTLFKDERRYIKRGLALKIYNLLTEQEYNFIIPALHPAEIYIEMEDFKRVFSVCRQYLSHVGEKPLIRQFEAYAYYQEGNSNSTAISTTYAIFDNVLQCNPNYLCPGSFVKKFDYLSQMTGSSRSALLRLPFALWKDGKTFIVPNDDHFEKYLRRCINKERKIATRTVEEDTLYFYHLQYLAEMLRLRNTRKVVSRELMDIRTEMNEINNDMFSAYMNVLSSSFLV